MAHKHLSTYRKHLRSKNIDELYAELDSAVAQTEDGILKAACVLTEFKSRGEFLPAMRTSVLKWHVEIAAGELSAKAALIFATTPSIITRLLACPLSTQDEIATTGKVEVAESTPKGDIKPAQQDILWASEQTLDLAFSDKGLRTFPQQAKILRSRASSKPMREPYRRIRTENGMIVCGHMRFHPEDFSDPLRELGFRLVRIAKAAA